MTKNPNFRVAPQVPKLQVPANLDVSYANMVRIAHMPSELVFDFALRVPGMPTAKITSRVMMSPLSAKLFHQALTENLAKFEATFGEIKIPGNTSLDEYSKLFRPPKGTEEGEGDEGGSNE